MTFEEAADEIIYRVIKNTPTGHYVPTAPADEHHDELEEKIGRDLTIGEKDRFEEMFREDTEKENDYKEMYEM